MATVKAPSKYSAQPALAAHASMSIRFSGGASVKLIGGENHYLEKKRESES